MHVTGEEIRKVRQQLGEDQTAFGARLGKSRRTIIRWEKGGTQFNDWGGWNRTDNKTPADLWRDLAAKAAKHSTQKSTTAIAARKPAPARRRDSAISRKSAGKSPARNQARRRKSKTARRVKK